MFKFSKQLNGRLKKIRTKKEIKSLRAFKKIPDEMTPKLFDDHSWNQDYIKIINIPTMLQRESKLPAPPKVDYRKLKNKYWLKDYDRPEVTYKAFKILTLRDDIYKEDKDIHEFGKEFKKNLKLNLSVGYGENYYDSALLGNFLEITQTMKEPKVFFPSDGLSEGEKYTLVMFTPGKSLFF